MSYDEQSQMWENERCQARPNAPLMKTFNGLRKYLQLGVPAEKLVLGVPWYGYRYPCKGEDHLKLKTNTNHTSRGKHNTSNS